ncbi:MAG: DUF4416 family protein [Desulfatirhabdiaceae bacterium]
MSRPGNPSPAKLVIGVFLKDKSRFSGVVNRLIEKRGIPDTVSPWFPFDFTSYYGKEMGGPLFRRMMSFGKLIHQDDLSEIKIMTNTIESDMVEGDRRTVNIDPGYLLRERFVLATGKNFAHRIHIGNGIYADLTLLYQNGAFQTLPWTYPDYARENIQKYLVMVRRKYIADLHSLKDVVT